MRCDDFALDKLLYEEVSQLDVCCFRSCTFSHCDWLSCAAVCVYSDVGANFKRFLDDVANVEALLCCCPI